MQRIVPGPEHPLFDTAALRRIEKQAAASLPPHALMQRAGLAVARLTLALAPHARAVWLACGPGNNGGDGLEAAIHLRQWGKDAVVTWLGDEARMPADAKQSLERARAAGVRFEQGPPSSCDLAIDALLGIGASRSLEGRLKELVDALNGLDTPVLSIDVPSGLSSDTGTGESVNADHTLTLLALKPGLFTGRGRDAAGEIWFDDLGVAADPSQAVARLSPRPPPPVRAHASHKGTFGDVAVIGGAPGMTGAALLAAAAALHHGAGRVLVGLLDGGSMAVDAVQPELMFRDWRSLDLSGMSVVCGCGGGDAVRAALPLAVAAARSLVVDADGLNAIAADAQLQALLLARGRRGRPTVLTPHPLEAARLLGTDAAGVQADRLAAAHALAARYACVVVLKGSGTVTAALGRAASINVTGSARLATAGTGDVLAGMVGARLARGEGDFDAARAAVFEHGAMAQEASPPLANLVASSLARAEVPGA